MTDSLLVNIIYCCCNALRVYAIFIFLSLFFRREKGFKMLEFACFAGYFLINSAAYLMWANPLINLADNILLTLLLTFLYKARWGTRVLATIVVFTVSIIVESIVAALFSFAPNIFESSVVIVITSLLLYAVAFNIKSRTDMKEDPVVSFFQLVFISLISAISIFMALVLTADRLRNSNAFITASLALLLLMNFIVIYLYDSIKDRAKQVRDKELLNQQNNLYIKQYETIFQSQRNIRILYHDMRNHMAAIQGLIQEGSRQEVIDYIQESYKMLTISSSLVNSGNVAIDSVINNKAQEAESFGIALDCQIKVPAELNIASFDLSAILFNLLDNAINAVKQLPNDTRHTITVSLEFDREALYIHVKNPFSGDILFEGGRIKTRHHDAANHGYGLESVRKTVAKYNGEMEINYENNLFAVDVLVFNIAPVTGRKLLVVS